MVNQTQKKVLLIDMGNSAMKWSLLDSTGLSIMSTERYPEALSSTFFTDCWQDLDSLSAVMVSCVAGNTAFQVLEKACDDLWNLKPEKVISLKEGFGLVNSYDDFMSLGSDRWCAMIGARDNANASFIVIDAGSALTIDVVTDSGKHLGGYIVPGIGMMKKSLGLNTAQITLEVADKLPSLALGKSTKDCVEAGLHLSAVKLIEAVFEDESKLLKNCQIFITGGDAKLLTRLLSFKCAIIPDLVLRGLGIIAANGLENN